MRVRVVTPRGVAVDDDFDSLTAEGRHGVFGVRPRHVDFVAAVVPGLLGLRAGDRSRDLAVDDGTMVKRGDDVTVAVWRAVEGRLEELHGVIEEELLQLEDDERRARDAIDRMRADFVQHYVDLEHER